MLNAQAKEASREWQGKQFSLCNLETKGRKVSFPDELSKGHFCKREKERKGRRDEGEGGCSYLILFSFHSIFSCTRASKKKVSQK